MKQLKEYINEKLHVGQYKKHSYKYFPKDKPELVQLIMNRLAKDKNANLNNIDTSKIINMRSLFSSLEPENIDISEWDVSNVEDMNHMFYNCDKFNCDISSWDVSNVQNMNHMFFGCKKFEGKNLDNWDVSKLKYKDLTFEGCENLIDTPDWYQYKER